MNEIGIIQRRLAENKEVIWNLEQDTRCIREMKAEYDEEGDLEGEYSAHNDLKQCRKRMKQLVEEQKFLKQLKRYL